MRRFHPTVASVIFCLISDQFVRKEICRVNGPILFTRVARNVRLILRRNCREEGRCNHPLRRGEERLVAREFSSSNQRRRGYVVSYRCVFSSYSLVSFGNVGAGVFFRLFYRVVLLHRAVRVLGATIESSTSNLHPVFRAFPSRAPA